MVTDSLHETGKDLPMEQSTFSARGGERRSIALAIFIIVVGLVGQKLAFARPSSGELAPESDIVATDAEIASGSVPHLLAQLGGVWRGIAVEDDLVVVTSAFEVVLFHANGLTLEGRSSAVSELLGAVILRDGRAYVGTGSGVRSLDLTNPTRPRWAGAQMLPAPPQAFDLISDGTTLMAALGESGVAVVDVTTADKPVLVMTIAVPGSKGAATVQDISATSGGALLALGTDGVAFVGRAPNGEWRVEGRWGSDLPDWQAVRVDVSVDGTSAAVLGDDGMLAILDIRRPQAPVLLSRHTVEVDRSYLGKDVAFVETSVLVGSMNGVVGFDASNQTTLRPLGSINEAVAFLATDGQRAYGIHGGMLSAIALVGEHGRPDLVARTYARRPFSANDVVLADWHAIVANGTRYLDVVNVGNPMDIHWSTTIDLPEPVWSLAVAGKHAFAYGGAALHVVDVHDPVGATVVASVQTVRPDGVSLAVRAADGLVSLPLGAAGAEVFDVSDPKHPRSIARIVVPSGGAITEMFQLVSARLFGFDLVVKSQRQGGMTGAIPNRPSKPLAGVNDIVTADRHAYVAETVFDAAAGRMGARLRAFDVAMPGRPVEIGVLEMTDHLIMGLAISGNTLYGLDPIRGSRLLVFDISDPTKMTIIGECAATGWGRIIVTDDLAFLPSHRGLAVIDVADPTRPFEIAVLPLGGIAQGAVSLNDDSILVATGDAGLALVALDEPDTSPTPKPTASPIIAPTDLPTTSAPRTKSRVLLPFAVH